jgi:hypothetical protein
MRSDTLITSSGIIKNRYVPRVGVVNAGSLYNELFEDCINDGIDLTWESYKDETMTRLMNDNPDLDDFAIEELFETESDCVDFDSRTFLLGAWIKNENGNYVIDRSGKSGSYALEYNTGTDTVCVEWSQITKPCGNTSPCYVMADGTGPCGDLDTIGDTVIAYTLPEDMFYKE